MILELRYQSKGILIGFCIAVLLFSWFYYLNDKSAKIFNERPFEMDNHIYKCEWIKF